MKFDVSHRTLYSYDSPVAHSQHLLHITPVDLDRQTVGHHSLIVEPAPAGRYDGIDSFGNAITILDIEQPHEQLLIHARSRVDIQSRPDFAASATSAWDRLDDALMTGDHELSLDVIRFRCASRHTTPTLEIFSFARASFEPGRPVLEGAIDLMHRIHGEFRFTAGETDVSTSVSDFFQRRSGVCQDFTHLFLTCLRALRIPARYVSGYLLTRPPPGQPRLVGADASHAWISVWAPETGWVDLDPTNDLVVSNEHITVASGRDYDDVSPISGVLVGGGDHSQAVSVDVALV